MAVAFEEKAIHLYTEAAGRCESLLGTIPRAFRRVAEGRKKRLAELRGMRWAAPLPGSFGSLHRRLLGTVEDWARPSYKWTRSARERQATECTYARRAERNARPSRARASWLGATGRHMAVASAMLFTSKLNDSITTAPSYLMSRRAFANPLNVG